MSKLLKDTTRIKEGIYYNPKLDNICLITNEKREERCDSRLNLYHIWLYDIENEELLLSCVVIHTENPLVYLCEI